MCFSNNVQVKYNLLENFALKICERETGWFLQKIFQFFDQIFLKKGLRSLKHRKIETKKMFIQYKTLILTNIPIIHVSILMQKILI